MTEPNLVDGMFRIGSEINKSEKKVVDIGSGVPYSYKGCYIISLSKTSPENSDLIFINKKRVQEQELIKILNLDNESILKYAEDLL